MRVNFLVNEVAGGWEPTDKRLGGTEDSVVRWAEELSKRGHSVYVYRNSRIDDHSDMLVRGVNYVGTSYYRGGGDICINIKSSHIAPKEPTLYLTNETDATNADLSAYLGVIWPSQWAVDNIPVNNKTFILPHGYDETKISLTKKKPKQCLYASSPDRGLETLLRAWPKVYAAHPDATLKVTYGAPEYDVPGVEFLGEVDEETMNQLYSESDIWCHPCNGGELFCIVGIKAQAAGCVPVVIPTMALSETVRHGYFANEETYADVLIMALSNQNGKTDDIRRLLSQEHYPNWKDSTDKLEEIIAEVLN